MAIDDKRRQVRPTETASLATIKDTKEDIRYDLDALSEGGDSSEKLLEVSEESEDKGDGLSLSDSDSEEEDGEDTQAKLLAQLNGGSSGEEDGFEEEAFDVLILTLAVRDLVPDLQAAATQEDYCRSWTISHVIRWKEKSLSTDFKRLKELAPVEKRNLRDQVRKVTKTLTRPHQIRLVVAAPMVLEILVGTGKENRRSVLDCTQSMCRVKPKAFRKLAKEAKYGLVDEELLIEEPFEELLGFAELDGTQTYLEPHLRLPTLVW